MRLALNLRYLGARGVRPGHEKMTVLAREAEQLGFSAVWVAENTGSDAPSLLSWLAAQTTTVELGSAVMQIPARTAAATAMTAATVDTLSEGRFRLGLGVSGPQVSEGWHGVRFAHPLARTREYVEIVRAALDSGTEPLRYDGEHYQLPLPGGPGKELKLGMRPTRTRLPIYLAAVGPRNLELAGEIADGWLSVFFEPESSGEQLACLHAGRRRRQVTAGGRHGQGDGHGEGQAQVNGQGDGRSFDVVVSLPVIIGDDLADCADPARAYTAHYLGGMGSRAHNFYNRQAARMGYGDAARLVQEHYLEGRLRAAAAAVPDELLDRTSLLGPVDRVADRMRAYADAGVDTLSAILFTREVTDGVRTLRSLADAYDKSGTAD